MAKLIAGYLPGTGVLEPFDAVFDDAVNVLKHGMDGIDALILWGGEDICPKYYGQKPHQYNDKQHGPSQRDKDEWKAVSHAKIRGIPIIGVCRGAQLVCAHAGGKLIQHVTNHGSGNHPVLIKETGAVMQTSSCHHQMMYPYAMKVGDYQLLAVSHNHKATRHEDPDGNQIPGMLALDEPEVVYFLKLNALAIQGHPEWMDPNSPFVEQCNLWVVEKLMTNLIEEGVE